jgi:ubiquitin C-terminal hydrolase
MAVNGVANLGNTCYVNTLIQCIGHTTKLKNIFKNLDCANSKLANELQSVLNIIWNISENERYICLPKGLLHEIYSSFDDIVPGNQHDLYEIFVLIFDKIINEIGVPISPSKSSNNAVNNINSIVNNFNNNKMSKLLKTIQGIQLSILKCESCGYQQVNPEVFITLMLDIPNIDKTFHFNDILSKYFDKDHVPDWKCDKCHNKGAGYKIMQLWKVPEVLIIVLKRFDSNLQKINTPINIPCNLTFSKGSILKNINKDYNYTLMAVGNHTGSFRGGHYYAFCKNNNLWYNYNDEHVNQSDNFNIQDAYILFYQKI